MQKIILFVCHGNICRSVMAENIMRDLLKKENFSIYVSSAAVSSEDEGSGIYPDAKRVLEKNNITVYKHTAHRITKEEFYSSSKIFVMDFENMREIERIFGKSEKVSLLLDREIADPWYTRDFERAFLDILTGCVKIIEEIKKGTL